MLRWHEPPRERARRAPSALAAHQVAETDRRRAAVPGACCHYLAAIHHYRIKPPPKVRFAPTVARGGRPAALPVRGRTSTLVSYVNGARTGLIMRSRKVQDVLDRDRPPLVTTPVPMLPCTVCGHELHLSDVVIVSREDRPPWASPTEETMTAIVHQACEPREGRADYNWRQEPPQTLLHALALLANRSGRA